MILPRHVRSGVTPKRSCAPPRASLKTGHDLVEDQDDPVLARDLPEPFEIPFRRRHTAHVPGDWLQDDGGELLALAREQVPHRLQVVVRQNGGISGSPLRNAGAVGKAEGRHARAGRDE